MKKWIKTDKHFYGNYTNSIRTSGEVVDLFVRDKVVVCKLIFFIVANLRKISLETSFFLQQNKKYLLVLFKKKLLKRIV